MVKEMCTIMKHGGPDDEGIYCDRENHLVLGHRRLSLIDLSDNGHQPMSYDNERFQISFNGEIYNFRELKSQLQQLGQIFKTNSDTEVILAAFSKWGTASFEKLNGMFAFALWDQAEQQLYLVRDASGIKPLYFGATKEGIAFSSEIRGFQAVPYLQKINDLWPVYFLAYGHLPEPVTTLKEVQPLPKGSYLCFHCKTNTYRVESFRKFYFDECLYNRREAMDLLREKLQQSVQRHLIADAPIGVFLSGGLDSGIVAMLANESKAQLNTLSLYFNETGFSEKKYQDLLLREMGCRGNQHLLKEEEFHQYLPDIFKAMDQPSCDGINTWFISKYAKESGLKAVLSGIGGDELYGGYPSFNRISTVNILKNLPETLLKPGKFTSLKSLKRLGYLSLKGATGKYLFLRGQFIPYQIASHLGISEEQVWKVLREQPQCDNIQHLGAYNQASWLELNLFMQNQLLRDVDVMSMAHGIETRVPFLDKELVDLSMGIPARIKSAGQMPKQLLIDSFKNKLPRPVWDRPKMGFGFPFKEWLANDEYAKSVIPLESRQYSQFSKGNMHWSQFLSLILLNNRGIKTSAGKVKRLAPVQKAPESEPGKILFLTLRTFSVTGGIEKVSRVAGKALYDLCEESGKELRICSMYDEPFSADEKYFPQQIFTGFGVRRMLFSYQCVLKGIRNDTVILSHLNLLPVGYFIKLLAPKTKLVLIAHGIEAWKSFKGLQKRMLTRCDHILSVSEHTKDVLLKCNGLSPARIQVLNNCLDPFLLKPLQAEKDPCLLEKYGIEKEDVVLMTLTRLSSSERYKGYDIVIESLQELIKKNPAFKYLIIGKYDHAEKRRLDQLIRKAGLESRVVFTGFVPDEELSRHFNLADIYIMPSEKEGFGIVFIEAMYYNKPVIAGNKDGSKDALLNGKLGVLVDPSSREEVSEAIENVAGDKSRYLPDHQLLMDHFSYPVYREKWREVLSS
jgi:asparagine synthase (glutamine-hydrolysing)